MKNIFVFLAGLVTGAILLFLVSVIVANKNEEKQDFIIFPEPRECISKKKFKVFQVIDDGAALAIELSDMIGDKEFYGGMLALFYNTEKRYYDEEIISVPKNNCVRQIGIYTYKTNNGFKKTVPIVAVMMD